jgi:branched-chain amino acid transport system permease protein
VTSILQHASDAATTGALYSLFALGIGMVFGIMRLVNIAHGELIMVGGYTLVLTSAMPLAVRLLLTVLVVVALALLMESLVFRPVRGASPTTLLVVSFALSFGLQSVVQSAFGARPRGAITSSALGESWTLGGVRVSVLSVATVATTTVLLAMLALFLHRTDFGTWMRASAEDFGAARMMGVRANSVVATAFAISGLVAAATSILLVSQTGQVSPTVGVSAMLFGLVGAVVGGLGSLSGAVVGGFLLGVTSVLLQILLPIGLRPYRDFFVFAAVFAVLAVRPGGLIAASGLRTRV